MKKEYFLEKSLETDNLQKKKCLKILYVEMQNAKKKTLLKELIPGLFKNF